VKAILLDEAGNVFEVMEKLEDCTATLSSISWKNGNMTGIKNNFVLLDDFIEIDEKTLPLYMKEFYKGLVIEKMKEDCNNEILSGFTSQNGSEFDFGYNDQQNLNQQMTLLLLDETIAQIPWKTKDDSILLLTREEFISLVRESEEHKRFYISQYWLRKNEINQMETVEEIKRFTFKDGLLPEEVPEIIEEIPLETIP
jgi:hypothetical protein